MEPDTPSVGEGDGGATLDTYPPYRPSFTQASRCPNPSSTNPCSTNPLLPRLMLHNTCSPTPLLPHPREPLVAPGLSWSSSPLFIVVMVLLAAVLAIGLVAGLVLRCHARW